jgi:CDP-diacylglycerol--glycerol-3-phosphate 3-phosphatidyltransferase
MLTSELLRLPNLLSLSRIILAPVIGYFIIQDNHVSNLLAIGLLILAGITDGLDGYLARKRGEVSNLGIALDPIADKVLAAILVIFLILYREFPIWLAAVIVGRDLVIVAAGSILMRGRKIALPSNLTGKYAFTAIIVLLTSYLIRFEFGIVTATWLTLGLIVGSMISYSRVFMKVRNGEPPPVFNDKPIYRIIRIVLTTAYSIAVLLRLYLDVIRG